MTRTERSENPVVSIRALLRAAHIAPGLAVVALATLLAVADDLPADRVALIAVTVLAGQLSVGWSNDLIDEARDRSVGRVDKPLAAGEVARRTVQVACASSVVAAVVLSLACGWRPALVHLAAIGSAWAYNLGLKSTWWSWAPYAFSFGGLVVFVSLATPSPHWPAWWLPTVGALLGVAAHLLNVLPDLEDDARTGVRGLPHRLGPRLIPRTAAAVLLLATVLLMLGAGVPGPAGLICLALVSLLVLGVVLGSGRVPFVASVLIALADVVLLVAAT